jgi:uncharacterized protein with NRDE domain
MCLLLIASKTHQRYPLIIAANRDEYYSRPSAEAQFWKDETSILAGRDMQAGGTWLGMTRQGRIAAVTNFHEDTIHPQPPKSRGELVTGFLRSDASPQDHSKHIMSTGLDYQGFTLVFGTTDALLCCSNRTNAGGHINPGVHGLGNYRLNDGSYKVVKGRDALRSLLSQPAGITPDRLFSLLGDRTRPGEQDSLSPIFITGREFGTRCSTVIMIDNEGNVFFSEKSFSPEGKEIKKVEYEFRVSE